MRALTTILILFILSVVGPGYGQTLFTRDTRITIAPNTTLTVRGDVENEGTIYNNGHLQVAGPWLNSGEYDAGEGRITFNGTSSTVPQIIHHNGQAFNSITISGGNRKVLLSDMVVRKQMTFRSGIVESAGDAKLVFEHAALIDGASDSSHVNGAVYQAGKGHKLFPLGDGRTYLPVELPDVKDPMALIGIEALRFGNNPPSNATLSPSGYWHVALVSGSEVASPIVLPLSDISWTNDPRKIVVVQSESVYSDFNSIGRSTFDGLRGNGRIKSEFDVSMPFVALGTAPEDLIVYNAVSNNGDGANPFVRIENIENYPSNKFTVFNRWGDLVFQIENYNNTTHVFRGVRNVKGESALVSGTYFYRLEIPGRESLQGFILVRN